jgi:hypothetical protein
LIDFQLDGFDLPDDLPDHLVPPSKKRNGGTLQLTYLETKE